ncbi:MAG: type II toxin-antitoxin system RelE/ParE family toxin [Flavobacteriaceae bacterium]|nr:type II toxin-antitoxin system RelE/ParE family toxin [Flavobacteriaceae bacterium]
MEGIQIHFEKMSKNPDIGKHRNEIKLELFGLPCMSHIIFYRILPDRIRIVRVLHGRHDLAKYLK